MEDDPGPGVAWILQGGPVDTIVLVFSLALLALAVAAATSLRNFRWPRVEKLVGSGKRLERLQDLLQDERSILDGLLVLRLLASITVVLSLIGYWDATQPGVSAAPGAFLMDLAIALAVFLCGIHGVVRGLVRAQPERTLLLVLKPARALSWAMRPLVWVMDGVARTFTRALGLQIEDDEQEEAREDILDAVSEGERGGAIDDDEREMIENIIEVKDQAVSRIMTPRTSVSGLKADTPLAEAVEKVLASGHSRIPVYEDTIDNICGILYAKDLLSQWHGRNGQDLPTVVELMRPALFIPETKKTSDLLEELRRDKVHLAVVVDEYGGTAGIVTIEDIIEEIVGEIEDEYDRPENGEKPVLTVLEEDHEAEMSARVHIDDLNDALHIRIPEGDAYDTVGGFLFHHMGRVPQKGETCAFDHVRFEVLDADERQIHSVKVTVGD